jgi:hypothetical protein
MLFITSEPSTGPRFNPSVFQEVRSHRPERLFKIQLKQLIHIQIHPYLFLSLKSETAVSLASFRKRADDARRQVQVLKEQKSTVDFAHYREILKNKSIVDEVEKKLGEFKAQDYDVQSQIKAIDAFRAKAVCHVPVRT